MKKILIVDDEKNTCLLLSHFLQGQGFDVSYMHDGQQGLEAVKSQEPDIVILDVAMPGMDGWQLLRVLQSSPRTRLIPVVMCTGQDMIKDIDNAVELGARGYITKPFALQRVLDKVNAILHSAT
ncbi:MAG: response regulator [Endomicrobiales bacterium]|jgi:CheY-like chemotaxis protein